MGSTNLWFCTTHLHTCRILDSSETPQMCTSDESKCCEGCSRQPKRVEPCKFEYLGRVTFGDNGEILSCEMDKEDYEHFDIDLDSFEQPPDALGQLKMTIRDIPVVDT